MRWRVHRREVRVNWRCERRLMESGSLWAEGCELALVCSPALQRCEMASKRHRCDGEANPPLRRQQVNTLLECFTSM